MKILITGGCGFIGSHLTDKLIELGHEVVVLDREPAPVWKNEKAEYIQRDVCDNIDDIMSKKFDAIYHLAAEVGSGLSMADPQKYFKTNSTGTANLLEAMRKCGKLVRVIVASSATVYGEATYECEDHGIFYPDYRSLEQLQKNEWEIKCPVCGKDSRAGGIKEERPLKPGSIYGLTKMDEEIACLSLARAWGFETVAFRPFGVFGPRQSLKNPYTGVLAYFAIRVLNGEPIIHYEDGLQNKGYIYIDDAVSAFVKALDNKEANGKVFNLGLETPVTIKEIADMLTKKINPEVKTTASGKFRTGDTRHSWPDTSYLQETLNWKTETNFEQGLDKMLDWLKSLPESEIKNAMGYFDKAEKYAKSFGLEV